MQESSTPYGSNPTTTASRDAIRARKSLLGWLKKVVRKFRKRKPKDLEIYPIF